MDGGLDIPHSDKRFAGFNKDKKELDADVHRRYIYGGHVSDYMKASANTLCPYIELFFFVQNIELFFSAYFLGDLSP